MFRFFESHVQYDNHSFVFTALNHSITESLVSAFKSLALLSPWFFISVRFRSVSVREGVYEVLARLAEERGGSISDVIADLINCCLNRAVEMSKVEELLKQCLENRQQTTARPSSQSVNTHETASKSEEVAESLLIGFENNPWVQIIRARVSGDESREGR